ncbi:hypothetical protein BGX38DRAFT_1270909 [Terfezia claveryi]|nr:hypothetical protein BGX38DRAFT_1270909 [Terfezia claveryi]
MSRTVLSRLLYPQHSLESPLDHQSTSTPHDPQFPSSPRFYHSRGSPTLLASGSSSQEVFDLQLPDLPHSDLPHPDPPHPDPLHPDPPHPVAHTDSNYDADVSYSTLTSPACGFTNPELQHTASSNTNILPFTQLEYYLSSSTLLTVLQDAPALYFHLPATSPVIPPPLLSRIYKSLRLDFSSHTSILRIWMPTPLHDSIQFFACEMLSTIPKRPDSLLLSVITPIRLPTALYVHDPISDYNSAYQPPPETTRKRNAVHSTTSSARRRKKVAAIMKTPDYSYLPKGARYPTVVFEVGWTEGSNDLYSDAEQWLVKTSGQVQLVITIGFIENNSPLAERRTELKLILESGWMKSRERFITCKDNLGLEEEPLRAVEGCIERTNLEQEVDGVDEDSNSDEALSPAPSTASDHTLESQHIDPNRWVGLISAKVNFFRYSKITKQMYKDRVEYILAPDGTVSPKDAPPPTLSMRDVWGAVVEKTKEGKGAMETTACVWDWKVLHEYVENARRDYAFNRKKDLVIKLCGD